MINFINTSSLTVSDKVRIQVIDAKGNGEVWYISSASGTGITSITKIVRSINPVCGKRMDKFTGRSMVKI